MYQFERSLVSKYKDKPFTIVAVNSDEKEVLEKIIADGTIKWPCFFDGGDTGGPIASQYQVHGWPTVYILDENGVIRYDRHGSDMEMDNKIYELLQNLKTKSPGAI